MTADDASTRGRFKISYDTSLLTLITFVISMLTLSWQIFNYFEGAQVKMIAPDQVTIGSSVAMKINNREGGPYVHLIARLSYVNQASSGYNATIRVERVLVRLKDQKPFEQQWYNFAVSDANGTELTFDHRVSSTPFPLAAGSSQSHETIFQPWPRDCRSTAAPCGALDNYIDWSQFLKWFAVSHVMELEFQADIYGQEQPVSAKCRIELTDRQFQNMVERGWASPVCTPV